VFPGGAVDDDDHDPALARRTIGLDDAAASTLLGLARGGLARWHAAARECFEEAGVLLARTRSALAHHDLRDDEEAARLGEWRHALNRGDATWRELLDREDLVLDARDLRVFAHWRTPDGAPRRYDTWFFVAAAPADQEAVHDDVELVESTWLAPREAIARSESGLIELILPTLRTLVSLSSFDSVAAVFDALDAARTVDGLVDVVREGSGERARLPGDARAESRSWTVPLPEPDVHRDLSLLRSREGVA
jgi:8-oxo-dGTP pyrophosphatase MutT (NUDIX family)